MRVIVVLGSLHSYSPFPWVPTILHTHSILCFRLGCFYPSLPPYVVLILIIVCVFWYMLCRVFGPRIISRHLISCDFSKRATTIYGMDAWQYLCCYVLTSCRPWIWADTTESARSGDRQRIPTSFHKSLLVRAGSAGSAGLAAVLPRLIRQFAACSGWRLFDRLQIRVYWAFADHWQFSCNE